MRSSPLRIQGRFRSNLFVLVLAIATTAGAQESVAQKVAVTKFFGNGAKKFQPPAHEALAESLAGEGLEVVTWPEYKAAAVRLGLKGGPARKPAGITALSPELGVFAVITARCVFQKKKRRNKCIINVFNAEGALLSRKTYKFQGKQAIPADQLELMTDDIGTAIIESPMESAPQVAKDESPGGEEIPVEPSTDSTPIGAEVVGQDWNPDNDYSDEAELAPTPKQRLVGAMSDILLVAGVGLGHRTGLKPNHKSGFFPAIRADGHFFLGSFTNVLVLRDIGFGGSFNMDLNLKYGFEDEKKGWDSVQLQWRGELIYRLALLNHVKGKPAFVFRAGYGSLKAVIKADDTIEAVKSVSYTGPHAGMDIYVMLFDPVLRLRFGGGMLFLISLGEDLDGEASGFFVDAGFDIVIPHWLHMSVGWEMMRFKIDDAQMGMVTDLYNNMYLRLGWNFDLANFE